MRAIAIDSSQDVCAIALGRGSQVLAEYHFQHKMNLLRRIVPNMNAVLMDAGCSVGEVDGLVVSLGPGSFTGLRIGVTVAKSLAYVLEKPIVGIGTLDAIARGVLSTRVDMICPMIFARADEVYWALFDSSSRARLTDYAVSTVDEALGKAEEQARPVMFCGTGALRNAERIRSRLTDRALIADAFLGYARGAALLDLGMKRLAEGDFDDALSLAPLYVRKPTPVLKLEETAC
jgi:tRNA threonylcarbamoyladenosine biosynthesis protein TsaB